ncbi:adenylate/guanylate cyclase domain-containing protein [Endothiovibrio diazotrophicus]
MTQEMVETAILFADISGSTELYERLGDQAARHTVGGCVGRLMERCRDVGGTVIKTIGDEVMCTFPDADSAYEAAVAMQETMSESAGGLAVRVGFHFGKVIAEGGDVFGDAVNLAARVVGLAQAGQILTSRETVWRLNSALKAGTRHLYSKEVKGKRESVDLFEVLWDTRFEATSMMDASALAAAMAAVRATLRLRFKEREYLLESGGGSLAIGRGPANDLVVELAAVSRLHARIDYREGKFILADQSTNGTYVRLAGGEVVSLRRDQLTLLGEGDIGFSPRIDGEAVIHFVVS